MATWFSNRRLSSVREPFGSLRSSSPSSLTHRLGPTKHALWQKKPQCLSKLHGELQLLAARHREYPFLSTLSSHVDDFDKLTRKSYKYFLSEFDAESERLLDLKEQALDPVRRFMAGPQAALFAEARSFINHNATNFSYLDGDEHTQLKQLLDDPKCYVGNGMKQAKTLLDNLRSRLETLASEARLLPS